MNEPLFDPCVLFSHFGVKVQASEIIRIFDGSTAQCADRADVIRYKAFAIYRPISVMRIGEQEAVLTLQFLKCSKERVAYGFTGDEQTLTAPLRWG
jgi:hypothetical protein